MSSVQLLSSVPHFATPWTAAHQGSLSITNSRVHPNPCPSSQWCHPAISSSVVHFSCPQSFPASESFQMNQFFASGGQSIGVSASTSVLPVVTCGCESWTVKEAERQRIDAFELWCWRILWSPLDCKEIQQFHPKGDQSWVFIGRTDEAETPILWLLDAKN